MLVASEATVHLKGTISISLYLEVKHNSADLQLCILAYQAASDSTQFVVLNVLVWIRCLMSDIRPFNLFRNPRPTQINPCNSGTPWMHASSPRGWPVLAAPNASKRVQNAANNTLHTVSLHHQGALHAQPSPWTHQHTLPMLHMSIDMQCTSLCCK